MTVKSLAMSVAAIAAVAAAAAGATSVAPISPTTSTVHPVVLGVPLPLAPSADVPSSDQLLAVLNGLGNPNVPFANKSNLVEGGISPVEARLADVRMRQAVASGETPLRVSVANIHPTGANAASADVTVSGPKLAPTTRSVTFVNHGGWKITHASAISLLQESGAGSS